MNVTLRQYAELKRRDMYESYRGESGAPTKAEIDSLYPDSFYVQDYIAGARDWAANGHELPARVLDSLYAIEPNGRVFFSLRHDYERSIPEGYLNPGVRHSQKLAAQELANRRREGRQ